MNALLSLLVIAGLLFGGGAIAVGAAQDDLPNEPLYTLKVWSEDVSLQLHNDPQAKVERLMELAQIRIQEMTSLQQDEQPIPDQVRLRLEQHIQQALQLCAQMNDPEMERALLQIRERLEVQVQEMAQLRSQAQQQGTPNPQQLQLMTQTQTMLQQRLQVVDEGLQNRELFREQVQNNFQNGQEDEITPPVQERNGQQNTPSNPTPGDSAPPNTTPDAAPTPSPNPAPGSNGGNNNCQGGCGKP